MEFLPIEKDHQRVYAGFWSRFGAGFIDALILLPFSYLLLWLEGFDRTIALIITIPSSILFSKYNDYFNARFGGTIGKLARGIKVTKPDGSRIGWSEAWKRSSVDLAYAGLFLYLEVQALLLINPETYSSAISFIERVTLLQEHYPSWYSSVLYPIYQIWIWSEVFVVLFNKRKRAIHDFIAGTVVIHKKFAEPVN
jgi:uncharacterized RDD family membrane protein YckC